MKILIIDDSLTAITILAQVIQLVEPSAEIYEAENGVVALEVFEEEQPGIVFTDLSMPEMDGYQTVSKLLSINPNTQIIVITSESSNEAKTKLIELGAKNLYTKPISYEDMQTIFLKDLTV